MYVAKGMDRMISKVLSDLKCNVETSNIKVGDDVNIKMRHFRTHAS